MYTLSPQERAKLAQARTQNIPSYVPKVTAKPTSGNFGQRVASTGVDIVGNILTGAGKTLEGIYDFGAGLVGGVGGLLGEDEFQKRVQDHIEYDFVGNTLGKAVSEASQYSYINDMSQKGQNIFRGVASGVGQILPAVAITAATGGLGAPAAFSQGLGTATFMVGAAGRGTEDAFAEGADYGKGLAYGTASGLLEGAIEKLSGGVAKNVFGKGLIDGVVKKVAGKATTNAVLQKGFKILLDAVGEGGEEAIAEVLNPYLKRLTYDKETPLATKEQILESALIGGLTSFAYQGTIGRIGAKSQNVTEGLKEIETLDRKQTNLWGKNGLTADEETKITEQRQTTLEEISRNLQRMNDDKRAKTIEQYGLGDKFALDGSLIEVEQVAEETANNENQAGTTVLTYNKQAYSPSLYGKEKSLAFQPTTQELTTEQREAKSTLTSLNKGKRKVNLVFADMGKDESGNAINGAYKNGTLYVSTQAVNPSEVVVKHELTHFAEGTREYGKFASYILRTISQSENLSKQFGNVAEKITETGELYKKVNEGKSLSEAERTILTEVVAQYTSENLFTSQEQIVRIAKEERSFAQKVLDWINEKLAVLKGKTKQERETIAFLRKAEKLYSEALDEAWGAEDAATKFSLPDTVEQDILKNYGRTFIWRETGYILKDGTRLDLSGKNDGARGGSRQVDHRDVFTIYDDGDTYGTKALVEFMGRGNVRVTPETPGVNIQKEPTAEQYKQIMNLVENIGFKERSFTVDFDNAKGDTIDSLNYDGYVSARKVISDIKHYFQTGEILKQSEISKFRYSLSLTDNKGRKLTEAQTEFFKDSKVRDEQGRLLEVYHGTPLSRSILTPNTGWQEDGTYKYQEMPFTVFKGGAYGGLIFTSVEESKAKEIADYRSYHQPDNNKGEEEYTEEGYVYSVYINSKKPFDANNKNQTYEILAKMGNSIPTLGFYGGKGSNVSLNTAKEILNSDNSWLVVETNKFIELVKKNGYDSIIGYDEGVKYYAVFNSNQIKLTTNLNPTESEDIRYSLTPTQKAKMKHYTKAESEALINEIITNNLDFGERYGELRGKDKNEVIEQLWKGLNTVPEGERIKVGLDIADYIIEKAVSDNIYDDTDNDNDIFVIDSLKPYLRSLDLAGIKGEIQSKYGNNTNVFAMWGKRKGEKGILPDTITEELAEQGFVVDSENAADIFFEINNGYKEATENLKNKSKKALAEVLSKQEQKDLRNEIAREVLKAYETKGKATAFGNVVADYEKRIADLKELLKETKEYNRAVNAVLHKAQKIKDKKDRKYPDTTILQDDRFKAFERELGSIKGRWDINQKGTRKKIAKFGELYNKDNEALNGYIDETALEAIAFMNENIESKKKLSLDELNAVKTVLDVADHLFRSYDNLIFDGKKTTVSRVAIEGVNLLTENRRKKHSSIVSGAGGVFKQIIEPRSVFADLDGYHENGVYQKLFKDLERGETLAGITRIELLAEAEEFIKKKYKKRLTQTIKYKGKDMPIANAISLYMTAQQEQGMQHLSYSGFGFFDHKGEWINVADKISEGDIAELETQFTAEDKKFMELARDMFDKSGELMTETDYERKGYTNVNKDGNYFPIKSYKGNIASNITDNQSFFDEVNSSISPSFTKDRVKKANNKLEIGNVFHVMQNHARLMGMYHGLAIPMDNFNRVYNKNVGEPGKVLTLRNYTNENVWKGSETYIKTLISDMQGVRLKQSVGDKIIDWIRSAFAKYQLGANPKVVVSQASAYPSAFIYLDIDSMSKGAMRKPDYKTMDEFCPFARMRDYDKAIVKAETVMDKLGTVGDAMTKPIQWMDRAIVGRLWTACQYQIEKTKKLKFGTKENMVEAGKLLEEVIRNTQGNHTVLERSALMRSNNALAKSFTMFMSDPLKHLSRLVENFGRLAAIRKRIKAGEKGLEAQLKEAQSKVIRTVTAVASANLMYVMIGMFFKWLYDRERKNKKGDEISFVQDVVQEFAGSAVGMLPIVRDVYGYFSNGYEVNSFLYGTLNDVIGATDDLKTTVEKIVSGEVTDTTDFMKPFRNSLFAMGQLTGVPIRNANTFMTGIIGKISPETVYKYKSMFYNANYTSDLNKALEKGDENLAETIVNLMMKDKGLSKTETAVNSKIVNLYENGYSVLPRTVSDYVTVDGERIDLTNRQQKQFKAIYDGASDKVSKMISSSVFEKLSEQAQAKGIKYIYDYYYNVATEDLLGISADSKVTLFGTAIDIERLSLYLAVLGDFETDKDKDGNVVNGSKKVKAQAYINKLRISAAEKYMLMGYLGYKNINGKSVVEALLRKLNLSAEQRKALLEYSGY